jgi:hypothetical protein
MKPSYDHSFYTGTLVYVVVEKCSLQRIVFRKTYICTGVFVCSAEMFFYSLGEATDGHSTYWLLD